MELRVAIKRILPDGTMPDYYEFEGVLTASEETYTVLLDPPIDLDAGTYAVAWGDHLSVTTFSLGEPGRMAELSPVDGPINPS